jgi:hypothetical protein
MSPGDSHLYQSLGLSKVQLSKMEPLSQKFHARLAELGVLMEEKKETLTNLLQKDRILQYRKSAKRDGRNPG